MEYGFIFDKNNWSIGVNFYTNEEYRGIKIAFLPLLFVIFIKTKERDK